MNGPTTKIGDVVLRKGSTPIFKRRWKIKWVDGQWTLIQLDQKWNTLTKIEITQRTKEGDTTPIWETKGRARATNLGQGRGWPQQMWWPALKIKLKYKTCFSRKKEKVERTKQKRMCRMNTKEHNRKSSKRKLKNKKM